MRVSLTPTFVTVTSELGTSAAAAKTNAAEEISPGTVASKAGSGLPGGVSVTVLFSCHNRDAQRSQQPFGVIARRAGFVNRRRAIGLQGGEQESRL